MGKVIGILSGKGGVGKTTVVVNLGISLEQMKKKVLIVEGNITSSNLGLHLGIADYPATIHDVLKGEMKILDAVLVHPSRVHYIPGSLAIADARNVNLGILRKRLKAIISKYDYILIDGSPGLDEKTVQLIKSCDEIIIVANPEITSITDAAKAIEAAKKEKIEIRGIILNKVKEKDYELSLEEIESTTDTPIIGIIPDDLAVPKSIALGFPVVMYKPNSPASRAFYRLAESISGPASRERIKTGFFANIKKILFG